MSQLSPEFVWLIIIIVLWTLPWKAVALWRAAKRNQKVWFTVLFLVNTAAILEIIYIFYFSRKERKEITTAQIFENNTSQLKGRNDNI